MAMIPVEWLRLRPALTASLSLSTLKKADMEATAFKSSLRASKENIKAILESLILDGPLMAQRLIKTHILTLIIKRGSLLFTMELLRTTSY